MARCSCSGSNCGCTIRVGDGLDVNGTGNASDPFVISLSSRYVAISQDADGPLDLSDVESGAVAHVLLSGDVTDVLLPQNSGTRIEVFFRQVLGGNTITWPATIQWPGGTAPALSATIGYGDWFVLRQLNTQWVGATEGLAIR